MTSCDAMVNSAALRDCNVHNGVGHQTDDVRELAISPPCQVPNMSAYIQAIGV